MDQRLPIRLIPIGVLLFLSPFSFERAHAETIGIEPPQIVEATPLNSFNERADGWNYSEFKGDELQTEAENIYQSLGHVAGVATSSESPHLSIRGSSSLARVLGLYQGVPMNMADGFGFSDLLVPTENLGAIRIIKGPASIFWGKDAMGGAINFLPEWRKSAVARIEGGSFGRKGAFAAVPLKTSDEKSGLQVTAYEDSTDGPYPFQSTTSGQSGDRKPSDNHLQRFTLNGHQTTGDVHISEDAVWAQDFESTPGSLYFSQNLHSNRAAGLAALSADWAPSADMAAGYRIYGVTNRNQSEMAPATPGTETSLNQSSRIGNSLNFKHSLGDASDVSVFIDHTHDEFQASYVGNTHFQTDALETGVVANIPYEQWMLKPGVRYLWSEKMAVPALGVFENSGGLSRWLTYSQGIRVPDLGQKFADTVDFKGNPDLKPETSEQVELGFEQVFPLQPWSHYDYGVAVFNTTYNNLLTYRLATPQSEYTNIGHANANGVEGNASYKTDTWGLRGQIAYTKTEDEKRLPLSFAPEVQGNAVVSFNWAIFTLELEDTVWSKYYENSIERTGWNTVDFHLSTVTVAGWEFKFNIYDIFDTPREIARGFPETQRRLWTSLQRTF